MTVPIENKRRCARTRERSRGGRASSVGRKMAEMSGQTAKKRAVREYGAPRKPAQDVGAI